MKINLLLLYSLLLTIYFLNVSCQFEDAPFYEDVKYGQYERNVLDFWQAESELPTPVVIYIHGGGFKAGDKMQARQSRNLEYLKKCLENRVSFASINYRFRQTTRLDTIMLDVKRAIQFIRSRAEQWNIDKEKIAAYGSSAGGGASIWLAFRDDMAEPNSPDPVLRESTRLAVVGHIASQATYDFAKWGEILGLEENWMEEFNTREDLELYRITDRSQYNDPEIIELRKFLDMPAYLDKSDPPIYLANDASFDTPGNSGLAIHHPLHPFYLQEQYQNLGLDFSSWFEFTPPEEVENMIDFFLKYLKPATDIEEHENTDISIFPNPSNDYLSLKGTNLPLKYSIFNTLGQKILKGEINTSRIIIAQLPAGIYHLVLQSENSIDTFKFAKN